MKITLNSIVNILLVAAFLGFIGRYLYLRPGYSSGETAPGFSARLIGGKTFELSDLRGNYILLDFWGSWCGPCRMENPAWVQLHRKYNQSRTTKGERFHLVSIGIERNEASWRRAIERDQLNWPHHILDTSSSLKFFNGSIARKYGVKRLPSNYLIDPDGEIIGVNLSPQEVDDRLFDVLQ